MTNDISNSASLYWLPTAPLDFSARCRRILETPGNLGHHVRALANHDLDENQLNRLYTTITKAQQRGSSLAPLINFRLGILSNSTTDFIIPALIATAARHGIALDCVCAEFGQVVQAALSPDSSVNLSKPDAVLIAVDYRGYPLISQPGNRAAADLAISASFTQLETVRAGIRSNASSMCIVQTLAPPFEQLFGSQDKVLPGTPRGLIEELNSRIAASIRGTNDVLFDVAGLASGEGLANWHSPEQWNLGKLPFSHTYLPLYAEHLVRIIAAIRGKSRRCLVLDLDNTLWGGVIGDDGLEGIQLAQGDAVGEAYLALQRYALALQARGVILAVSSKNNDDTARAPFREHPEMLLKERHIAVFQANWDDKATNIKAIADALSLGLESLVFVDDNPAERAIVRAFLPQVAIPELPSDPALYARTLSAAGYFEAVTFSNEDLQRAEFYQENARRITLQSQVANLETYLASLKMVITFQPFDETSRTRITQLINKSNQFNLTTRRYTETEVARLEADPNCLTLQVRLADMFGDNGMISVVICRGVGHAVWEFDTWLMSCRVLGRRVEHMLLQEVLSKAREVGIKTLIGRYIPTERNTLVEHHYKQLGFTQISTGTDSTTLWELDVTTAIVDSTQMEIRRLYPATIVVAATR